MTKRPQDPQDTSTPKENRPMAHGVRMAKTAERQCKLTPVIPQVFLIKDTYMYLWTKPFLGLTFYYISLPKICMQSQGRKAITAISNTDTSHIHK